MADSMLGLLPSPGSFPFSLFLSCSLPEPLSPEHCTGPLAASFWDPYIPRSRSPP